MLQLWGRQYGIGLIALAVKEKEYRPLASLFPDELLVGLFEELCLTHPNQSAEELWGEEGRALFLASFKNKEIGAVVHDWFVFREDFLAHGNPRAALEKTRGSFWAHALEGIIALAEEQNPTAALCAFEKVLKHTAAAANGFLRNLSSTGSTGSRSTSTARIRRSFGR